MLLKKGMEDAWKNFIKMNSEDPYSKATVDYMVAWAELMEQEIDKIGVLSKDQVDQLSHDADTDGITGFMYDMARRFLDDYWLYGDDLTKLLGNKMTSIIQTNLSNDEIVDKLAAAGYDIRVRKTKEKK